MPPKAESRPYWLAALVIGMGLICLWGALSLPAASRYAGIGPGSFPMIVGGILVVLGLILAVQIARGERFEPQEAENADAHAPVSRRALVTAILAAALPILTLERLGLPLTAMISFALVARAFGSPRLGLDLLYGVILGSLAWVLFDRLGLQLGGFLPMAGI
jgi:putative tricarboxylic transport membrane protein